MKNEVKKKKSLIPYILLFWLLLIAAACVFKFFQNDTFYTIKIGKLILNNGIDMKDHFSFHNLPYTYPHWLYDVFIYLIYYVDGFRGIYISTIVLFIILLFTMFKTTYNTTKSYTATFFSLIICLIAIRYYVTARAQLVSYILFVIEIYSLDKLVETNKKRYYIYLLIISLLLCNIHVAVWPFYFILFLPYIAEGILSIILSKTKKDTKFLRYMKRKFVIDNNIKLKPLFIIMFLSIFTGLLTPIKDTPYTYLIKTMLGNSQKYINEHKSIPFTQNLFTIIIIVETFFWGFFSKIKARDFFLLLGLSLMGFMAIRHLGLLAILGSICLAKTISLFLNDYIPNIDEKINSFFKKIYILIPGFIIVIFVSYKIFKDNLEAPYVVDETYPVEMVKYIKKNMDYKNMRMFNEYDFGSYLLLNDIPVFIDSRADLYTKEFNKLDYDIFDDYMNIFDDYEEKFDFYKITHVLVINDSTFDVELNKNENYKIVEADDHFTLYERLSANNE